MDEEENEESDPLASPSPKKQIPSVPQTRAMVRIRGFSQEVFTGAQKYKNSSSAYSNKYAPSQSQQSVSK